MVKNKEAKDEKELIRTGLRMDPQVHRRLTEKLAEMKYAGERVSLDAAFNMAVEYWLNDGAVMPPPSTSFFDTLTRDEHKVVLNFAKLISTPLSEMDPARHREAIQLKGWLKTIFEENMVKGAGRRNS